MFNPFEIPATLAGGIGDAREALLDEIARRSLPAGTSGDGMLDGVHAADRARARRVMQDAWPRFRRCRVGGAGKWKSGRKKALLF